MGMGQVLLDGHTEQVFKETDILAQTFLEPPQITQLAQAAQQLGFDPGTLVVDDMVAQAKQLLE
jgi:energy-coupling factor transport system ATP-binding protein